MDGIVADLPSICDLAERYGALMMVDDSHAVGFVGAARARHAGATAASTGRVDIVTGTLGKALGGASGGYTAGAREIIELLRQRSRPYLFSNTLAPAIAAASLGCWSCCAATKARRCGAACATTASASGARWRRWASPWSRARTRSFR